MTNSATDLKKNLQLASYKSALFWLSVGLLFFLFIYLIKGVLLPFVLGAMIAYFLDPAADKLETWKFSRTLATALITLIFFTIIGILALLIFPTIVSQLSGLISDLPSYVIAIEKSYESEITGWLRKLPASHVASIKEAASNFSGVMMGIIGDMAGGVFHSGLAIFNMLSLILITPVVAFYLLRDWDLITTRFIALLPRKHEHTIRAQLQIIDATLAGFIRGQLNVCLLLGAVYAIGLTIVGLKFSVLIGLATGFLVIIPYVGQAFGTLVGLCVAYFQFGEVSLMIPTIIVFAIGQLLEGSVITPKLVGEKVGLHPVWIIFGLLSGAALFGFVGVLIAVPVSAVIGVLIRFFLSKYLHSSYYHGK